MAVTSSNNNSNNGGNNNNSSSSSSSSSSTKQSWLLRWFESKMFDMSYAVMYLFNSKETGVQTYIGNRMFSFPDREVDFYLQQLVNMYIHVHDVPEVIHPYLVHIRASIPYQFARSRHHRLMRVVASG